MKRNILFLLLFCLCCLLIILVYCNMMETKTLFNNPFHLETGVRQSDSVSKSSNPRFSELLLQHFNRKNIQDVPKTTSAMRGLRRVLSYCVFGRNALQKYASSVESILKESSKSKLYRDWEVWLFTNVQLQDSSLTKWKNINPKFVIKNVNNLTEYANLETINAMTWRFVPIGDDSVDISCIRDIDSPLLKREQTPVREFLDSDYIFHGMRDNPNHFSNIMGGMWCFRNTKNRKLGKVLLKKVLKSAERRLPDGSQEATKGNDQDVLNSQLWPVVKDDSMTHDSYLCNHYGPQKNVRPFPKKRVHNKFVGCVRPCIDYDLKLLKCPAKCRPRLHQDWIYC